MHQSSNTPILIFFCFIEGDNVVFSSHPSFCLDDTVHHVPVPAKMSAGSTALKQRAISTGDP